MDTNKMRSELRVSAESAIANNPPGGNGNPFPALAVRAVDVQTLLAEIEGLHAQHDRDSDELRKLCSARDSARRQRDQLKAENEALLQSKDRAMSLLDQLETQHAELKAALKPLEREAERYRWLRRQPNDCSAPRIDICHWTRNGDDSVNEGEGLRGPQADEAIDAAMAKEASHD